MLLQRSLPLPHWWQYYLGTVQCRQTEASLPQPPQVDLRFALPAGGRHDNIPIQFVSASAPMDLDPFTSIFVLGVSVAVHNLDVLTIVF